jgi:ATP-dependent DNA helicase RecQ
MPNNQHQRLHQLLKQNFGHTQFRFNQLAVITTTLSGKDALAIMPTGGGKSICYQLPAIYHDQQITVVISPLISLMHDQVLSLQECGVTATFLNSTQDFRQQQQVKQKIMNGEIRLLYLSPESALTQNMIDFLTQLQTQSKLNLALIAIDEAHCVSQWGHEFRRDYMRLGELRDHFPQTPMLALTATADERTRIDIAKQLHLKKDSATFISSFDRPNIRYQIHEREEELSQLDNFIREHHYQQCGIVYCLSRKKVERIADELVALGYRALPYHAGMSSEARQRTQTAFNQEESIVIVATIAFGMGIDRPDVRYVAHLDLPKSVESYYQETGRAGRDGAPASAWMVYGLQDVMKLSQMLETTDADQSYKKRARSKLDSMLALCEMVNCRRQFLLSYFGEQGTSCDCNNCDNCLQPAERVDATEDAKKILSTIYRTGEFFGAGHIVDVLRGSKSEKVIARNHHQLSVYGIGKKRPKTHWNMVIRQLLNQKYLEIKNWEYRSLGLTTLSGRLLKNNEAFQLRQLKREDRKDSPNAKKKRHHHDNHHHNNHHANNSDNHSTGQEQTKKHHFTNDQLMAAHQQVDLYEQLRILRLELAKKQSIAPFMIFSNRSLHDMCLLLPRDRSDFLMVNGVGERKCQLYGDRFLAIIAEHL